ncbi:MAG: hypothetical protein EOM42_14990 [Negativicutes bacterium]|nr:hypothetical protein [Negativicutes bacterium]
MTMIEELLIADGWEKVPATELAVGDYVAWCDDFAGWAEGKVTEPLDSKSLFWQEGHGSIKAEDVLYRRPKEFPRMTVARINGKVLVNASNNPRNPGWVEFIGFYGDGQPESVVLSQATDVEVLFVPPEVDDEK